MRPLLILTALVMSACGTNPKETPAYKAFAVPANRAPAIYADAVTKWTINERKSKKNRIVGYSISKNTPYDNLQISCGVAGDDIGPHLYTGISALDNTRYHGVRAVTYQFGGVGEMGIIGMNVAPRSEGFSTGNELTAYVRSIANSDGMGSITYIETQSGTMLYHSDMYIGDALQFRSFLQQCGTL